MAIVKLNLARNCLKYLIKVYGIKEIFTPYYTCETVWTSAKESGCKISFYHIDKNFMPIRDLPLDAFIVYTNYYGLCTKNCRILAKKYPHIIIDNAQAFYAPHCGMADFNSLRKFFPVQNGAYLCTTKVLDERFSEDNLELTPTSAQENFEKFVHNELQLNKEKQIIKLDYSLNSPIERTELVRKICENADPETLTPRYLEILSDYIIFEVDREERKKQKDILSKNRLITINTHETSYQGLVSKLENGEDGSMNAKTSF